MEWRPYRSAIRRCLGWVWRPSARLLMVEPPKLAMPADVTARARRTVDRHLKSWLFGATVDALAMKLGSPSEAAAAAHRAVVENWVHAWQASRLDVRWEERRWPSLGRQLLPVVVTIEGADAIPAPALLMAEMRKR